MYNASCVSPLDHGNQKWEFYIMARINRTCGRKQLSKSTATLKVHMNQHRMNARSTNITEEEEYDNELGIALDNGVKTHCMYAATIDAGQI
jgi:hypothetical protein